MHFEPEPKRQSMGWKRIDSLVKVPVAVKVMLTVFWNMKGPITVEFVEKNGAMINSTSYCQLLR